MRLFIFFIVILFFISCKQNTDQSTTSSSSVSTTEDDFDAFYKKFHEDSLFQMSHIVFPLDGLPNNVSDSILAIGKFQWQKEDWIMHKPFDATSEEFIREVDKQSNSLVVEFIRMTTGEYGMERRFAKLGGKWFLIHYTAMNKLVPSE